MQWYSFNKNLSFTVKTHTDVIFTTWLGSAWKHNGTSVLGLGLRRMLLPSLKDSLNSNVAYSTLIQVSNSKQSVQVGRR